MTKEPSAEAFFMKTADMFLKFIRLDKTRKVFDDIRIPSSFTMEDKDSF